MRPTSKRQSSIIMANYPKHIFIPLQKSITAKTIHKKDNDICKFCMDSKNHTKIWRNYKKYNI